MQSSDIKEARIINDYNILIRFENGEQKVFDLKPYLDYHVFKALKNKDQLNAFRIVERTIEWDCGADLSPDTFYFESKPVALRIMEYPASDNNAFA